MRVLHLDLGREMRGGQWQVLSLVRALGPDAVLMARARQPLAVKAREAGVRVLDFSPGELWMAARRFDLAHAHDSHSHQWMAALLKIPFVVSRRVAFPISGGPFNRWKYSRAAHFLAVSDFVKRTMMLGLVPGSKISVIYDGVELAERPSRGGRLVAVATDDPMKGSEVLREAAAAGGFEVHFSSDLIHDLQTADLFLYITHSEGLGSAALLAMAAGVPVVASRVGGLPEIVNDGVTGFLTQNEPDAVAAAVKKAMAQREALGRNARVWVEKRFTTQTMVENTVAIYKRIAKSA